MYFSELLHLFVVDVGDVVIGIATLLLACVGVTGRAVAIATAHVVGVEAGAGVCSITSRRLLGFVHVLAGGLPGGVDLSHGGVDLLDVAGTVGGLQLVEGGLDGALLVGGNLVAIILILFFLLL